MRSKIFTSLALLFSTLGMALTNAFGLTQISWLLVLFPVTFPMAILAIPLALLAICIGLVVVLILVLLLVVSVLSIFYSGVYFLLSLPLLLTVDKSEITVAVFKGYLDRMAKEKKKRDGQEQEDS